MRVEIIEEETVYQLENRINERLRYYKREDIIDIKYSGTAFTSGYGQKRYSAMIICK